MKIRLIDVISNKELVLEQEIGGEVPEAILYNRLYDPPELRQWIYIFSYAGDGYYNYTLVGCKTFYDIPGHRNVWVNRTNNNDSVQETYRGESAHPPCVERAGEPHLGPTGGIL